MWCGVLFSTDITWKYSNDHVHGILDLNISCVFFKFCVVFFCLFVRFNLNLAENVYVFVTFFHLISSIKISTYAISFWPSLWATLIPVVCEWISFDLICLLLKFNNFMYKFRAAYSLCMCLIFISIHLCLFHIDSIGSVPIALILLVK